MYLAHCTMGWLWSVIVTHRIRVRFTMSLLVMLICFYFYCLCCCCFFVSMLFLFCFAFFLLFVFFGGGVWGWGCSDLFSLGSGVRVIFSFILSQNMQKVYLTSQQAHNLLRVSYQRRYDVMTLHRRRYDVILTSCACWVQNSILTNGLIAASLRQMLPPKQRPMAPILLLST